jgi:hypothetical protein
MFSCGYRGSAYSLYFLLQFAWLETATARVCLYHGKGRISCLLVDMGLVFFSLLFGVCLSPCFCNGVSGFFYYYLLAFVCCSRCRVDVRPVLLVLSTLYCFLTFRMYFMTSFPLGLGCSHWGVVLSFLMFYTHLPAYTILVCSIHDAYDMGYGLLLS